MKVSYAKWRDGTSLHSLHHALRRKFCLHQLAACGNCGVLKAVHPTVPVYSCDGSPALHPKVMKPHFLRETRRFNQGVHWVRVRLR